MVKAYNMCNAALNPNRFLRPKPHKTEYSVPPSLTYSRFKWARKFRLYITIF